MPKKDSFYSKLSLILGLGFWIPLLNIPLSILAIISGIAALRLIHLYPKRYGGRICAVIGIVLGFISIILFLAIFLFPDARTRLINDLLTYKNATNSP